MVMVDQRHFPDGRLMDSPDEQPDQEQRFRGSQAAEAGVQKIAEQQRVHRQPEAAGHHQVGDVVQQAGRRQQVDEHQREQCWQGQHALAGNEMQRAEKVDNTGEQVAWVLGG